MELAELLKSIFTNYGAAALPWSVVAFLGWFVLSRKGSSQNNQDHNAVTADLLDKYHEVLVDNTRTLERLATLLEERTRRQAPDK